MSKFSMDADWVPAADTPDGCERMRIPVLKAVDGVVTLTPLDTEQVDTFAGATGGSAGVAGIGLVLLTSEVAKLQETVRILSARVFELEVERTSRGRGGAQQLPHGHGDDGPAAQDINAHQAELARVRALWAEDVKAVDARLKAQMGDELQRRDDVIRYLWRLLDDVDTLDDVAKGDDVYYRAQVRKTHQQRWRTGITTDGYTLDLSKMEAPRGPREAAVSRAGWNTPGEVDFAKAWRPTDSDRAAQRSVLPARCLAGVVGCDLEGPHGHPPRAALQPLHVSDELISEMRRVSGPSSRCMHGVVGCPAISVHVHPCGAIGPWSAVAGGRGCEREMGHSGMHMLTTTTAGQQTGEASW